MGLFDRIFANSFENWVANATDMELENDYEERRKEWASTGYGGDGETTPEMKILNSEMNKRSAERWENDPNRNRDPHYRWTDANRWDKD